MKRRLRWAAILLAAVAVCAIADALIRNTGETHRYAGIYRNGELLHTIDTYDKTAREYEITGEDGAFNVVTVDADGCVRVTDASCRDRTCVRHGELRSAAPIVCLPNRVVVKWLQTGGVDAVSGAVG